ncbi:putative bifunctional diguanylate cyclase/phosphodiesterase [Aliikangiella sp. IMCC44632]
MTELSDLEISQALNNNKGMVLSELLNLLQYAAFCWTKEGYFTPVYQPPQWFKEAYREKYHTSSDNTNAFYLGVAFPFIENFLFDAEEIWALTENAQRRSGLWTEVLDSGLEIHLEAIAVSVNQLPLLLIANETHNFDVRHKIFQNARNLALKNEQLEESIQRHQRELHQQLEQFYAKHVSNADISSGLKNESSAVLICKQNGRVEVFNQALVDIYAIEDNNQLNRQSLLEKWVKEAESQYPEIHRVLKIGKQWEGEFETADNLDNKKWVRLMIAPLLDEHNKISRYICIANDISKIKLSVDEIQKVTQIDPTTHLPNRQNFWQFLTSQIEDKQTNNGSLALIYIDLDHFKQVNDDLGPQQADFLLNTVASRLKRCLKKQDYVAHLGGDEFAIIVSKFQGHDALKGIAQRVKEHIYRDVSFQEITLNITSSIGIAIYPEHGIKARQLVKSADYAMYHAKEMGRNQFQFSGPYSKKRIQQKLHIEQGLKSALSKGELNLMFQPQICIGKKHEHRVEALIRWQHPIQGMLSPASFISIAEESGIILEIGEWVLKTGCELAKQLNQDNIPVIVCINVSPKQFKYSNFPNVVEQILTQTGVAASQLELEVTESVFLEDMENVVVQLKALQAIGVSISLDDFGTGYSSLSYLKRLPVDILKIDRSFISELPYNRQSKTIVESLINMAHELSIEVIAEGVENNSQLDYLKQINCDYVQGFLFHAPLASADLVRLYQSFQPNQRL